MNSNFYDNLILELNGKDYPIIEKVMTFYYDFKDDINILCAEKNMFFSNKL